MWSELKVANLLQVNAKQWNTAFINYVFDSNMAEQIYKTPLLPSVRQDTATWRFEKNGNYSVRSAYRDIINNDPDLNQHRVTGCWNSISNLKLPPKVMNFMWRACRNCLPTKVKLHSHGVQCPMNCVVCAGPNEDISHLFFECGKSISCWQRTGMWNAILQIVQPSASCVENVFSILQQFDSHQKQVFGVTLWSIWQHRNNRVWNDVQESVQDICDRAGTLLTSWQNAQVIRHVQPNNSATTACVQWKKPSPGRYKCNVDAYFEGEKNHKKGRLNCVFGNFFFYVLDNCPQVQSLK